MYVDRFNYKISDNPYEFVFSWIIFYFIMPIVNKIKSWFGCIQPKYRPWDFLNEETKDFYSNPTFFFEEEDRIDICSFSNAPSVPKEEGEEGEKRDTTLVPSAPEEEGEEGDTTLVPSAPEEEGETVIE